MLLPDVLLLGCRVGVTPTPALPRPRPALSAAGKMLLYGALLRCLDPVLTIAAAQGWGRPVFWSSPDKREEVGLGVVVVVVETVWHSGGGDGVG